MSTKSDVKDLIDKYSNPQIKEYSKTNVIKQVKRENIFDKIKKK